MGFLRQPAEQHKMSPLFAALLLAGTCSSFPNRQRYTNFKNFPVLGTKGNHEVETPVEKVEEKVDTDNVARAARQVEPSSYTDSLDDVFVEEAVYLTPEDRDQRAIEIDDSELSDTDYDNYEYNDNFEYNDETLVEEENERPETDADSSKRTRFLRSRTLDKPQLRIREEEDRLDRLELLWEFSVTLQVPREITTSTSQMRMGQPEKKLGLLMPFEEATVSFPPRVRMLVSSMLLMRLVFMLLDLMSLKHLPCLLMCRDCWTISLRSMASLDYRSQVYLYNSLVKVKIFRKTE